MPQMDLSTLYNRALQARQQKQNIEQGQQAFQLQQQQEQMAQAGREAQFLVSAFGEESDDPQVMDRQWAQAIDALGRAGGDVQGLSPTFDAGQFRQIQGLAQLAQRSQGGAGIQFGAQETFKDEKGNLFFGTQRRNPRTGQVEAALSPVGGGTAQPVGQLSMVSSIGLTPEEQVTQVGAEATEKEKAKAGVELQTRPDIEAAIVSAKEQAKREEQRGEAAKTLEDLQGSLIRMRELTEKGIYTGAVGDRLVQGLASGGIVFDQEKLNRTTRVRQIATNLKFMAKPAGMGAMSDSEWKIIRDAIPDPESATTGQLLAGLEEFESRLEERAGQQEVIDWSDL